MPVHAFPPFFSRADGLLANHNRNTGQFARESEYTINECDGLDRVYGSAGFEIVGASKGSLIDTYI
ncbi:MAG: hypothetical protein B6I30_05785 [Desulfobacteraceae bacterium 4572_187]|nr:MAG: hypothetical protein B6I30_05785 [Desulfobacteraceae bacterium 4572_187]